MFTNHGVWRWFVGVDLLHSIATATCLAIPLIDGFLFPNAEKRGIVHDIFRWNGVEIIHELWGRDDIFRALPTSGRSNPSDNAGLQSLTYPPMW